MKINNVEIASQSATFVIAASDSLHKERADYVCDGVDDEVEIQAAIAAIPSCGGKIVFTEGSFSIGSTINVTKPVTLEGASFINANWPPDPMTGDSTVLILADNADCVLMKLTGSWADSEIRGFWFDGNSANNSKVDHGIDIDNSGDTFIANCMFHDFNASFAIRLNNHGSWITYSEFEDNLGGGVTLYDKRYWITHSYFRANCLTYTNVDTINIKSDATVIADCRIKTNPNSHHIYLGGATNALIHDNYISDWATGKSGVRVHENSAHINIHNNILNGWSNGSNGVSVPSADYVIIQGNDMYGLLGNGIDVTVGQNTHGNIGEIKHIDLFMDVLAASANAVHAAITGTGAEQEITTAITNPDVPRNVSITNSANSTGDVVITGIDAKGNSMTDTITIVTGGIAYGVVAFATVSKITVPATVVNPDTITVGISDKLGLSNIIYASDDVYKVKVNNADDPTIGTVNTTYGTVDCATINAADDITIWYKRNLNMIS